MENELMGRNEYARHRGCSQNAVKKAEEDGRIAEAVVRENGVFVGIKYRLADRLWSLKTDPIEAERNGKLQAPLSSGERPIEPLTATATATAMASASASASAPTSASASGGDQENFLAARTKEADLRGRLLELDVRERTEELLPRAVVQREFSEIFSELKSSVFRIPDRKAQALAVEGDPTRLHRILTEELRMVFDEFSRRVSGSAVGSLPGSADLADDTGMDSERAALLS